MKIQINFYLIAGLIFALAACNSAESDEDKTLIDASAVPEAVVTNFENRFIQGDSLIWRLEDEEYEAEFSQNGKRFEASFLPDGELIAVESDLPIELIPANVTSYIDANYAGAKVTEAARVMDKDGNFYKLELDFNGEEIDLIFDTL